MKKIVIGGMLVLGLSSTAMAEGWKSMPYKDADWSPEFTLALTTGTMDTEITGLDSNSATGLQLSLNCPWFSPPNGNIRQQFNYNQFDHDDVKITTFELNPHWYFGEGNLTYGPSVGFGYVWVDPDGLSKTGMWSAQVGADVEYRSGAFFLGAGIRYQATQNKEIAPGENGASNTLAQIKVGVNF